MEEHRVDGCAPRPRALRVLLLIQRDILGVRDECSQLLGKEVYCRVFVQVWPLTFMVSHAGRLKLGVLPSPMERYVDEADYSDIQSKLPIGLP